MKSISLTKGYRAYIDDEDSDLLNLSWHARVEKGGKGRVYAGTNVKTADGRQKTKLLHRIILERVMGHVLTNNELVYFKDDNTLNNTRANLRPCTKAQNSARRVKGRQNKSGYKGVYWNRSAKRWAAQIKFDKQTIHLGYFDFRHEANEAYRKASKKYYGEFAP